MAFFHDVKYLRIISPRLSGFTQKRNDLFNCKCIICNDSQKNKSKKRGYFFKKDDTLLYKCFNCDVSMAFSSFLKQLDPQLYQEYQLETYLKPKEVRKDFFKPENFKFEPPRFNKPNKLNIPAISELPDYHYAKQYLVDRKIPKGSLKDLYYAKDFKEFVLSLKPDATTKLLENDSRIVIPFRNESGVMKMFQGRALDKNLLRYISVKLDDDFPKLFGLDKIDKTKPIIIVESPLDSLFLPNCLAVADANLEFGIKFLNDNNLDITLLPDLEPRNSNIVRNIGKFVNSGYKVCLLPTTILQKDVNEMIIAGYTKPQIHKLILDNTYQGLEATMVFEKWRKV